MEVPVKCFSLYFVRLCGAGWRGCISNGHAYSSTNPSPFEPISQAFWPLKTFLYARTAINVARECAFPHSHKPVWSLEASISQQVNQSNTALSKPEHQQQSQWGWSMHHALDWHRGACSLSQSCYGGLVLWCRFSQKHEYPCEHAHAWTEPGSDRCVGCGCSKESPTVKPRRELGRSKLKSLTQNVLLPCVRKIPYRSTKLPHGVVSIDFTHKYT